MQPLSGRDVGAVAQPWSSGSGGACAIPPSCRILWPNQAHVAAVASVSLQSARARQRLSSWPASCQPRPHRFSISATPWTGGQARERQRRSCEAVRAQRGSDQLPENAFIIHDSFIYNISIDTFALMHSTQSIMLKMDI